MLWLANKNKTVAVVVAGQWGRSIVGRKQQGDKGDEIERYCGKRYEGTT